MVLFILLSILEEDAAGFSPLIEAYALPRTEPGRAEAIEAATEGACMAPLAMMGECCRAITLLERMREIGAPGLVSDVATGALLAGAALEGAGVNVCVNTTSLKDRRQAARIEATCDELLDEYAPRARALADAIVDGIRGRA